MVTSPKGNGVIVMGGKKKFGFSSREMFELSHSMQWTRLEQTLQIDHDYPLVITIPDQLVYNKPLQEQVYDFQFEPKIPNQPENIFQPKKILENEFYYPLELPPSLWKYKCPICKRIFPSAEELGEHVLEHNE